MSEIVARCMMCGKKYELTKEHSDYKKLVEQQKEEATFICDVCNNRVRHESDDKKKNPKSI